LGSGAPEIGKLVADKLHTDYVDREIIAQVAERLHWPKQDIAKKEMPPGSSLRRIAEALGRGYALGTGFEGAYLPTWAIPLDDTRYIIGLESVIKELAGSGSIVIRGRGSQFILRDFPGAFHVLVIAPLELRMKRVMKGLKLDEKAAKQEIERFDSSRREFTKRYFQAELEDPAYYDIVISTEHLSFEGSASIIVHAVPFKNRTAGG
jgi:hypothetical protein